MHICYISYMFGFSHVMLLVSRYVTVSHGGDQSTARKHVAVKYIQYAYFCYISSIISFCNTLSYARAHPVLSNISARTHAPQL